jgi:PAS domain S-box-containing protein
VSDKHGKPSVHTLEATLALEQYPAFLERAQKVAHVGSWVAELGESERVDRVSWSAETHRIFGIPVGEFDGTPDGFFSHVHPHDVATVRATVQAAIRGSRPYDIEYRIVTRTGELRWVHSTADVDRRADNSPVRLVGTVQDVTERRRLEEQLRHAQKMEAVGRLAGGLAHELNNALMTVMTYSELVLPRLEDREKLREDVEEIRQAAGRAVSVAQQLLTFGRRELTEPLGFSVNQTVHGVAQLLEGTLGSDVALRIVLDPALPSIMGHPGQVEQALVNLSLNAREAMPRGGELVIATSVEDVAESVARLHPPMPSGRYVVVSVADTGRGLDPETNARIFEPFVTTKQADPGTGLGLAMVWNTVKQGGGHVLVESGAGHGATFRLYFPALG